MSLGERQAAEVSPLVLAYVGDAVWELFIRSELVAEHGAGSRVSELHRLAKRAVNAESQSAMVHRLMDHLAEDERDVVRRGRNVRPGHIPRTSGPADYRCATGFEALLGFLYLTGRTKRLGEVLAVAEGLVDGAGT
ncbi:MAG TPA: ribonuclease III [Firmicutes bacterium]|nr:ribonuclease III [Bacillota bacterium]